MMNIGPEEAGRMDLWTYQALLHNWNLAHSADTSAKPLTAGQKDRLERAMKAHELN